MNGSEEDSQCNCGVCMDILILPVSLPCKHHLCKVCFEKQIENNGFSCPFCRYRLSNWLRIKNKHKSDIVNRTLWETIQRRFPDQVENRMNEKCDNIVGSSNKNQRQSFRPNIRLAEPGELRQEYEEFVRKEKEELKRREEENYKMSLDLIKKLEEEEMREQEERLRQLRQDEEMAKSMKARELQELQQKLLDNTTITVSDELEDEEDEEESDVTNTSPYTNSDGVAEHADVMFLGPCAQIQDDSLILVSDDSFPVPLCSSTPHQSPSADSRRDAFPINLDIPSTSKQNVFAKYFAGSSGHQETAEPGNSNDLRATLPMASFKQITPSKTNPDGGSQRQETPKSSHLKKALSLSSTKRITPSKTNPDGKQKPVASAPISSKELSNFAPVMPGPSTSWADPGGKQLPMSRASSGADSIGQELHHFKPIRTSPTTPPKEGSACIPQVVIPQKGVVNMAEEEFSAPREFMVNQFNNAGGGSLASPHNQYDLPPQDQNLEDQIEADKRLALRLQNEWIEEEKRQERPRVDYNLRKKKKPNPNLRKKVLIDRAQKTLDMFIK